MIELEINTEKSQLIVMFSSERGTWGANWGVGVYGFQLYGNVL